MYRGTYSRQSRDLVADVLEHDCKLVQGQAVILILVIEFEELFDL